MIKICDDPGIMNHSEAVGFFNRLIIDLKLRELGEPHDPITMERLKEASAHVRDIAECKRYVHIRRNMAEIDCSHCIGARSCRLLGKLCA